MLSRNRYIIEIIVSIFFTLITIAASESHVSISLLKKTKKINSVTLLLTTSFVYLILFIIEGSLGSFLHSIFKHNIRGVSFLYFVVMSFTCLFVSININKFRSVNRIIYESKIIKLYNNTKNDINISFSNDEYSISSNSNSNSHSIIMDNNEKSDKNESLDENNIKKIVDNFNAKNTLKDIISSSNNNENHVTIDNNNVVSKIDKKDKDNDTNKSIEEKLINKDKTNYENDNNINNVYNIHITDEFHHEIKELNQYMFENKFDKESDEIQYELIYVLIYLILRNEILYFNFFSIMFLSIIMNNTIFLTTSSFTTLIFYLISFTSEGKLESVCFKKIKFLINGFTMILFASYTYYKHLEFE